MFDAISPQLQENVAQVLLAALAFAIVWLLRHFLFTVARNVIRRFTRDRNSSLDQTLYDAVNRPVSILTLALAVDISSRILGLEPAPQTLVFRFTRTLVILAVIIVVYRIIGTVGQSRSRLYSFTGLTVDNALLPFVRTGLHLLLFAIGAIIIVQVWGYDVTGLVAGLGLGGLAFSLAAQETVSNIFGFSMIVSDRPFVVGEFIKTPDVEGIVERVGLRSTTVRQLNQAVVTIPNSKLASSPILNWSRLSKRWIDFTLRVNYGATPDQLEALMSGIRAMLAARPAIDESSIVVHFIEFGESALQILVRAYVNKPAWLEFTQEREQVNLEIMRLVTDAGLSIAYPTRSLYIERLPEAGNELRDGLRMLAGDARQEDPDTHRS
jgi:MscS family membrane protein